jgi:phosphoribosyl 1,2-cyclic phosphodiesterase
VSGEAFLRYGGHTSCVALSHDGVDPTLVLDAGTGLQLLAAQLDDRPFRGTVLLSHLHWDHTQGLPFFPPGDRPEARVTVLLPEQPASGTVLSQFMGPPFFPITPGQLRGAWSTAGLADGEHDLEGFRVLALDIPHRGGRTFGFRVSAGGRSVAYLSDHCPLDLGPGEDGHGAYHPAARALCQDADLLLHDAQYTTEQLDTHGDFGHSTVDYAVGLAQATNVTQLLLFHHEPTRTDAQIDAILAGLPRTAFRVRAAAEGSVIDLPAAQVSDSRQLRPSHSDGSAADR